MKVQRVHKVSCLDKQKLYTVPQKAHPQPHMFLQDEDPPTSLGLTGTGVPGRENYGKMDWQRRPSPLATSFTGLHTSGLLSEGLCHECCLPATECDLPRVRLPCPRVCKELGYRLDLARDTKVACTEVCYGTLKILRV